MQATITLNGNQAYKKYKTAGGTLSFTEFLDREKQKIFSADGAEDGLFLVNKTLNDSVNNAIQKTLHSGGLKNKESGKTVFGIHKGIVIGGGILLLAATVFLIVKKTGK